jgi:hypothetical protein
MILPRAEHAKFLRLNMSAKAQLIIVHHQILLAFDKVHHLGENPIGNSRRKGRAEKASCRFEARRAA